MPVRPEWDDVWFAMADIIAHRSHCDKASVGAVIVDRHQNVVSCSYNGPPPNFPRDGGRCSRWCPRAMNNENSGDYDSCPSNHAEANGIARADRSRTVGATIYVTRSCCMTCAKLIASAGIVRVVHRVQDADLHRSPDVVESFLRKSRVAVQRYNR